MAPAHTSDTLPDNLTSTSGSVPTPRAGSAVLDDLPLIGCVVAVTADRRRGELAALFTRRGAKVVGGPALGSTPPDEDAAPREAAERRLADRLAADRLVDTVVRREVHAVTFTSAADVTALVDAAEAAGVRADLLAALRTDVTVLCSDAMCARPLELLGVNALWPERARFGAMVSTLCTSLPQRIRREVPLTMGRTLVLQGFAAVIDDTPALLPPLPAAVLAELARQPGWVVSRADLLRRVWAPRGVAPGKRDEHAVEATVARLRAALGPNSALVKTVTKRGYRLAVDGETW
jgi:uroporphyrinogen-III synthase